MFEMLAEWEAIDQAIGGVVPNVWKEELSWYLKYKATERQRFIYNMYINNPTISEKRIASILGITQPTVHGHVKALELGLSEHRTEVLRIAFRVQTTLKKI